MGATEVRIEPEFEAAVEQVQTPEVIRRVARWLVGGLVVTAAAMLFAPWVQTSRGAGRVIAYSPTEREQVLEAPVGGRVAEWFVTEGAVVHTGEVLARIEDNAPDLLDLLEEERLALERQLEAAQANVTASERQVESLERAGGYGVESAEAKIAMSENKRRAAANELLAAQAELETAELNLAREEKLAVDGLTSQRSVELAGLKVVESRTKLFKARAGALGARSDVLGSKAEREQKLSDADAKVEKARSELEKARADQEKTRQELAKLAVRIGRQQTMVVRAPRAGTVLRIDALAGNVQVKAGDALAVLVPDTNARAVEIWVDGNDAPLITPGRHVRLQFEGWPAVQFSGWPSVAVGTFGGQVSFVDAVGREGKFRVVIVPDEADEAWPEAIWLRQGARVNGQVQLNEVSVGYELWRQINGFPATVLPGESGGEGKKKAKGDDGETDKGEKD